MTNKKQCLISYAKNGREPYEKALDRNRLEAAKHYQGDFVYLKDELPTDCATHQEAPYQFKPKLFKQAFDQGYNQVIWLDSTVVVARDLAPVFNEMTKRGVIAFHNLGHNLNLWIGDKAAQNCGLTVPVDPKIAQIMACVVGFDIDHPKGKRIFDKWLELSEDGETFQNQPGSAPGFKAHRHDQAALSALLHLEEVKLLPYGSLVYQPHDTNGEFGNDFYFINKAIK